MKQTLAISKSRAGAEGVMDSKMDVLEQLRRSFDDIRAGRIRKFQH